MSVRILLVEDDPLDASMIKEELEAQLKATVSVIKTEGEFVSRFEEIAKAPPDLIVLDVMLRWAVPSPDLTEDSIPAEVREEGFYTAGLRCVDRLEKDNRTQNIPSIIYTGLDKNNFAKRVVHTKSEDLTPLVHEIRKVLALR